MRVMHGPELAERIHSYAPEIPILFMTGESPLRIQEMGIQMERCIFKLVTAAKIREMMSYTVAYKYGAENYPGLELCAKSGTAEVGGGASPHAWFVGFITNTDRPLAFVVIVENGGYGSAAGGAVANAVLQAAVNQ